MAVTSCRLMTREAEYAIQGQHSKVYRYLIDTDSRMSEDEVYAAAQTATPHALPALYSVVGRTYVIGTKLSQQTEKTYTRWVADVTCGQLPEGQDATEGDPGTVDNPLLRPVLWSCDLISKTEILEKDRNGSAILNTAGQPYDEPPTRERYYPVIIAQRNFATWEEIFELNEKYDNAVNKDLFVTRTGAAGRPVETLFYLPATPSVQQYTAGTSYYTAEFRFAYDPKKWRLEILSRGWKHYTKPVGVADRGLVNAVDDEGQLVTEPVLLAADGQRLAEGQPGYYLTHYINPLKNFAPLVDLTKSTAEILAAADL